MTRPLILCDRVPCHRPHVVVCGACNERLCATCYGAGSSTKCNRCFTRTKANA